MCSEALNAHKGDVWGKDVGYKGRNVRNITCTHLPGYGGTRLEAHLEYGVCMGVCSSCLTAFIIISFLEEAKFIKKIAILSVSLFSSSTFE
jgi:hypothetical protein